MKKLFAILSVSLLSVFGIFFSCSETSDLPNIKSNELQIPKVCKEIGIQHNAALESAFQSLRQYYTAQSRAAGKIEKLDRQQCEKIMLEGVRQYFKEKGIDNDGHFHGVLSRGTGGDDPDITPIVDERIVHQFSERIEIVLDGEIKTDEQIISELNAINSDAANSMTENDAMAVYAGTSTCYYSYTYWKLNFMKWWVAYNRPDLLNEFDDETLNQLILDNNQLVFPTKSRGWLQDIWNKTGETWNTFTNYVNDWWKNGGGKEVVAADAGGAATGALKAWFTGPYSSLAVASSAAVASIGASIEQWIVNQ